MSRSRPHASKPKAQASFSDSDFGESANEYERKGGTRARKTSRAKGARRGNDGESDDRTASDAARKARTQRKEVVELQQRRTAELNAQSDQLEVREAHLLAEADALQRRVRTLRAGLAARPALAAALAGTTPRVLAEYEAVHKAHKPPSDASQAGHVCVTIGSAGAASLVHCAECTGPPAKRSRAEIEAADNSDQESDSLPCELPVTKRRREV